MYKHERSVHKSSQFFVLLYVFSLVFEGILNTYTKTDFIITKITAVLFIFSEIVEQVRSRILVKGFLNNILLVIYFLYLLIINFINNNHGDSPIFDVPLLLNTLIFILLYNKILSSQYKSYIVKNILKIYVFGITLFLFLYLFNVIDSEEIVAGRLSILHSNSNELGLKFVYSALIIYVTMRYKSFSFPVLSNILYLILFILMFYIVLKTGSRVALLSLTASIVFFEVKEGRLFNFYGFIRITFLALLLIIVWIYIIHDTYVGTRILNTFLHDDLSGRNHTWDLLLSYVNKNPIFGIGEPGYYESVLSVFGYYTSPHNVIIEIYLYTGLIGVFVFALFLKSLVSFKKLFLNKDKLHLLVYLFWIPIIGLILSGQILHLKFVWIFLALSAYNKSSKPIQTISNK